MKLPDIVVPISSADNGCCTITAPWFVQYTQYRPHAATYKPLVNGEEAFAAVYHAIAGARKSVDIICWGFQPSMYFIRDGKTLCIGDLLAQIAREKKVQVRVLGWEMPFNSAGWAGEANLPGKGPVSISDRRGQTATDAQYARDQQWFREHLFASKLQAVTAAGMSLTDRRKISIEQLLTETPVYASRGFNVKDRAEIAYRAALQATDRDISAETISTMAATATHHQKTVLVDFELPESAIGFVMGHNMLDEYWDTDAHTSRQRGDDKPAPDKGPRGALPRQDISCQITGTILADLHDNFARSWRKETGEDLLASRNVADVSQKLKPRRDCGTPLMAQLLRTQAQENRRDIEQLYLQTVNNATHLIYIENQYFRWPPLAEAIKKISALRTGGGSKPEEHGYLHLFVVTNVTDEGIGAGTVNTQRMLASLGRADTIPEVTRQRELKKLREETFGAAGQAYGDTGLPSGQARLAQYVSQAREITERVILPEPHPGLKVHICSLVAKDSPAHNWMPVYIHSKLMIVNDVFTTHGSANINTRSMQVDSEMNIAHEWASVTKALRQRLWNMHTSGRGAQDDPAEAFKAWEDLLKLNEDNQSPEARKAPEVPLIKFLYSKATLKDMD
ncbi:MAG TPA: phospholipase D-like domain-containing protein [Enterobacteriaceae bacterium]|nr:phospholipase D-like domain-containing protein [Enterobacteriaceae bacterium]